MSKFQIDAFEALTTDLIREEGRERVRTIGGDELVRLFLGCAAEEAFPCE